MKYKRMSSSKRRELQTAALLLRYRTSKPSITSYKFFSFRRIAATLNLTTPKSNIFAVKLSKHPHYSQTINEYANLTKSTLISFSTSALSNNGAALHSKSEQFAFTASTQTKESLLPPSADFTLSTVSNARKSARRSLSLI